MFFRPSAKLSAPLTALVVLALAVLWSLFAPTALGGQATYVVVNGNSMEPLYHRGDLVILRRTDDPQIGDIFAYRYPDLGMVIHRIIARDGEFFIFKGDHNTWNDGYHPTLGDLVGKAWLHIPNIGSNLIWLRQPLPLALLTGLIGGLLMFGIVANSPKPGNKKKPENSLQKIFLSAARSPERQTISLFGLSFLLLAGVVLGIVSFSRPATKTVDDNVYYAHSANYRYSASGNPKVYDQAVIQSGDPVFPQLTCEVDISMDYAIASTQAVDVQGSYRMYATISEFNGWKRTIELVPATAFGGATFHGTATLDVCKIRQMVDDVASLTGISRPVYNVSVVTRVDLTGQIGGRDYQESIMPPLSFGLDAVELYILRDDSSGTDPFGWKKLGFVPGTREESNSIFILGLSLPVMWARIISILAVLAAITGLGALGLPVYQAARQDELTAIHLKYAHMLISMDEERPAGRSGAAAQKTIDVKSMDDLARLAQNAGLLIMEKVVDDEHHFVVLTEPYRYRYVLRAPQESVMS